MSSTPHEPKKVQSSDTLIGVDLGLENTGVALGRNSLVAPLDVLPSKNQEQLLYALVKIALENRAVGFVIGLPLGAENKETAQSLKVRQFANRLKAASRRPVYFQNEFFTTQESVHEALNTGISQKSRRKVDHLAAALILKNFYSEL